VPDACPYPPSGTGRALSSSYASRVTRILVIEDDDAIADPLGRALQRADYDVVRCGTGAAALALVGDRVDLVVLDLGLPDVDGVSVCRELRRADSTLPIVMLTARSNELDVIVGLDAGADDYVAKPFRLNELLARIRARVRTQEQTTISVQDVEIDESSRRVWRAGEELDLAAKEFDLVAFLARRAGSVVTREEIMGAVWDEHWFGSTRTLDVHVSWLRKKLGDGEDAKCYITTVRGVGFRFEKA
jgi:DNA-binding response OmpR family regulator